MRRWPVFVYLAAMGLIYLLGALLYLLMGLRTGAPYGMQTNLPVLWPLCLMILTFGILAGVFWRSALAPICFVLAAAILTALGYLAGDTLIAGLNAASIVVLGLIALVSRPRRR